MTSMRLALAATVAGMLMSASALAQTAPAAPAAAPAPAATAPAAPMKAGQKPRTAQSIACSGKADQQGLHGKPRKSFMSKCKAGKA